MIQPEGRFYKRSKNQPLHRPKDLRLTATLMPPMEATAAFLRKQLVENENSPNPLSMRELAEILGVPGSTLRVVKTRMKAKERGKEETKRRIEGGADPTTLEGRLELLSQIALSAPDGTRVKALEVIEELSKQLGQGVGPGAPLTREERVERLKVVLQACEKDEIEEAMRCS